MRQAPRDHPIGTPNRRAPLKIGKTTASHRLSTLVGVDAPLKAQRRPEGQPSRTAGVVRSVSQAVVALSVGCPLQQKVAQHSWIARRHTQMRGMAPLNDAEPDVADLRSQRINWDKIHRAAAGVERPGPVGACHAVLPWARVEQLGGKVRR